MLGTWVFGWLDRDGRSHTYAARINDATACEHVASFRALEHYGLVAKWNVELVTDATAEELEREIAGLWRTARRT